MKKSWVYSRYAVIVLAFVIIGLCCAGCSDQETEHAQSDMVMMEENEENSDM